MATRDLGARALLAMDDMLLRIVKRHELPAWKKSLYTDVLRPLVEAVVRDATGDSGCMVMLEGSVMHGGPSPLPSTG
jgi:hypothetical protein